MTTQKALMRLWRGVDFDLDSAADVRNDAFDGIPQNFRALALEIHILLATSVLAFPNVERFTPGGVHVDDVFTVRRDFRIEHRRNKDGDDVLRITQRSVPVQHAQMGRIEIGQTGGVDAEEQVHDATECGNLRHFLLPRDGLI